MQFGGKQLFDMTHVVLGPIRTCSMPVTHNLCCFKLCCFNMLLRWVMAVSCLGLFWHFCPPAAHGWLDHTLTVSGPHVDVTHPDHPLQVGYKSMMYMVLHAEAVLDLVAVRDQEIQFRQVAGSFVQLQGKFLLHSDQQVRMHT